MSILKPSLRIKLNNIIIDKDYEKLVLENIRRCARVTGRGFKVVFWHKNLIENDIKRFIKRNENLLFEMNAKITKKNSNSHAWFVIDIDDSDKSLYRYKWKGDILVGLVKYIELVSCLKERDN